MLTAITHSPSPALNQCELTITPEVTTTQHKDYCDMLRRCGVSVLTFDHNNFLPDCVFVEDAALVLGEIGIILSMGAESRRKETEFIESQLVKYRDIEHIALPAQLEGGDILLVGKTLYVGISSRSNLAEIEGLKNIVNPYRYQGNWGNSFRMSAPENRMHCPG